ncbi:unnamed protein product [Rhizopus stolonifer]
MKKFIVNNIFLSFDLTIVHHHSVIPCHIVETILQCCLKEILLIQFHHLKVFILMVKKQENFLGEGGVHINVLTIIVDLQNENWLYSAGSIPASFDYNQPMQGPYPNPVIRSQAAHPDHVLQDLFFPMEMDTKPTVYNQDVAQRLDQIQSLLDAGTINPSNFNFNITNDHQLSDMNNWLTGLSNSIEPYPLYNTMSSNFKPEPTQYPVVPSQMYNDTYVRSQPIVVPSQNLEEAVYPGLVGQRQHYTTIPDMASNYFSPELRTATNFTNSKEEVKFKPTKTKFEEKKNMAKMINTFSSALDPKVVTKKEDVDRLKELIVSDLSDLSISDTREDNVYPETDSRLQKHARLLKQMKDWINQSYKSKNAVETDKRTTVVC